MNFQNNIDADDMIEIPTTVEIVNGEGRVTQIIHVKTYVTPISFITPFQVPLNVTSNDTIRISFNAEW